MTNISWTSIATTGNESVLLSNTINQDLQNLNNSATSLAQDEAIAQELQEIAAGNDSRFSSICTSSNPDWATFQSGFTTALNQTLGNFVISASTSVTINGQPTTISTTGSDTPLTLANYKTQTANLTFQFQVPYQYVLPYVQPTIGAPYLSADQQKSIANALYWAGCNNDTETVTTGGVTCTVVGAGSGSGCGYLTVTLSGNPSQFGSPTLSLVPPGASAMQPLLNFLTENL